MITPQSISNRLQLEPELFQQLSPAQQHYLSQHPNASVEMLIEQAHIPTAIVTTCFERQFNMTVQTFSHDDAIHVCRQIEPSSEIQSLIQKYQSIPIKRYNSLLIVATTDPSQTHIQDAFQWMTGLSVQLALCDYDTLKTAIEQFQSTTTITTYSEQRSDAEDVAQQDSIQKLLEQMLQYAWEQRASAFNMEATKTEITHLKKELEESIQK